MSDDGEGMNEYAEMYDDSITLSAYRQDEEPWRLERLNRILGYVCALGRERGLAGVLDKIGEFHDHKGVLVTRWQTEPTEAEKRLISEAWGSIIGDGNDEAVNHEQA